MPSKISTTENPWIIKYANVEDASTGDSFEVFAFNKTLGRKGTLRIERDKARDSRTGTGRIGPEKRGASPRGRRRH